MTEKQETLSVDALYDDVVFVTMLRSLLLFLVVVCYRAADYLGHDSVVKEIFNPNKTSPS